MKLSITQKDEYGCGIACISFVSGKSYLEVSATLNNNTKGTGYSCRELCCALNSHGLGYTYKYIKPKVKKLIYKDSSIVFVKRTKKFPAGHYLVRYNNLWMDPWINFNNDKLIDNAISGFRKKLPEKPIYVIFSI